MVIFNPAAAGLAVLSVANANIFAGTSLNSLQQAILALPGRDVPYVAGRIQPHQVTSLRPSYINAILIQRAGHTHPQGDCLNCQRRGLTPFTECRRTQGHFGGCCGNCKWREHAQQCPWPRESSPSPSSSDSFRTAPEEDEGKESGEKAKQAVIPEGASFAVVV